MKTMYTNSGEKVVVTDKIVNFGHGDQVDVIYSDGSKGLEHVEDLHN